MRRPGLAMRMTPDIASTIMSPLVFETFTLPEADVTWTSLPISVAETEPLAVERWASRSIFSTRTDPEADWIFTWARTLAMVFAPEGAVALNFVSPRGWMVYAWLTW